ncbi:MAG: DUF167 domain-containing protein [Candidatus Berkelbacteria bacterium]|nr:MAG: DUF167 domain-containing protein [Candidatus Berkelbacteria bacterium]QQG52087.1 MAG: DUF167 domain-containing protein [Candidatus Berkelbacteria bacterium]
MKIFVKVKAGAGENAVERLDATHYAVSVTAMPVKNQANTAVIELISKYLNIPKSTVVIKRGQTAKQKTLEILGNQELFK